MLFSGLYGVRQFWQMVRTSRWPSTASRVEAMRNGSTFMSISRVIAPEASFVCSVLNTRWPVSDAWMAISAVSRSRISPTMMMSGSWRRKARSIFANVSPIPSLIGTWMMPSMSYSTGSSAVSSLDSIVLIRRRAEYSVVVLPEPVGPVTMTMPFGLSMSSLKYWNTSSGRPMFSSSRETMLRSSTRSTTLSPNWVGRVETRKSMGRPPTLIWMRPSCGSRRSAMSRPEMTLMRDVTGRARCFGGGAIS